jgi:hypothetical protein
LCLLAAFPVSILIPRRARFKMADEI